MNENSLDVGQRQTNDGSSSTNTCLKRKLKDVSTSQVPTVIDQQPRIKKKGRPTKSSSTNISTVEPTTVSSDLLVTKKQCRQQKTLLNEDQQREMNDKSLVVRQLLTGNNSESNSSSSSSVGVKRSLEQTTSSHQPLKKQCRQQKTIDEKHREMVQRFEQVETVEIPNIKKQIQELERNYKLLRPSQLNLSRELVHRETIAKLESQIKKLVYEKQQYYKQNAAYLFKYFEDKQNSSETNSNGVKPKSSDQVQAFIMSHLFTDTPTSSETNNSQLIVPISANATATRYWYNVEGELSNLDQYILPADQCYVCGTGQYIHQEEDGVMICNNSECGAIGQGNLDTSKNSSGDSANEACSAQYERLTHFKEILSQFQAKETTTVSPEIMTIIRARIKKERITSITQINNDKMREMLGILKFNKLNSHIPFINSILGNKPPFMDDMLHNTLCKLFIEIQQPWSFYCPPDRIKYFSYTYVLHQLCVLLDQKQYIPFIQPMKDLNKQHTMNLIWKKVCDHLDWAYEPM